MSEILIEHGKVVTMDRRHRIIDDGAVAIEGDSIVAVGRTEDVRDAVDPEDVIDASGRAVLPGFISTHAHVNDVLLRGRVDEDRPLHDWLLNINKPGVSVMDTEDHALSAALYCTEAIQSGITFFVDNAAGTGPGLWLDADRRDARLEVYDEAGMRNAFAQEFVDGPIATDERFEHFLEAQRSRAPETDSGTPEPLNTAEALDRLESLFEEYHGSADGRQSVWPAPLFPWAVSREGLRGSLNLAKSHDVMSSTHVSEVTQQERHLISSVEYLHNVGYLGEHVLLGHCVHVDERDIRLLAETNTRVSHNLLTNLSLGSGIAPIPTMQNYGVTVGIGTDNTSASDTVNLLNDVRFAAMVHDGHRRDPGAISARKALEMATIDGARAIGKEDDLGSLEPGKKADIVLVDLEYPHLTPAPDISSALVYRAQGFEVETVICNGVLVMEGRTVVGLEKQFPDLLTRAEDAATEIADKSGISALE
jgi:cytosine/adenosine deaminase-related metal-dependent hydrolase